MTTWDIESMTLKILIEILSLILFIYLFTYDKFVCMDLIIGLHVSWFYKTVRQAVMTFFHITFTRYLTWVFSDTIFSIFTIEQSNTYTENLYPFDHPQL